MMPVDSAVARSPRVCVVHSVEAGLAYDRLEECGLELMAVLPQLSDVNATLLHECEAVVIGCSERMLLSSAFRRRAFEVSRLSPTVAVVALPGPGTVFHAIAAGFRGLVARDVSPLALRRTVAAATRGQLAFPRDAFASVARLLGRFADGRYRLSSALLTPRQRQIVDLIAEGATDRDIAERLKISRSTAHKHVQNALRRVGAKTRSQLVAYLDQR
jgi:DNA-binding NarL/FixJ family response regulator